MADDSLDYDSYLAALADERAQQGLLGPSDYNGSWPQAPSGSSADNGAYTGPTSSSYWGNAENGGGMGLYGGQLRADPAGAPQTPQGYQMPANLRTGPTPSPTDAGVTGSVPLAANGLPDPNQLYAQLKGAGAGSEYTRLAPGVTLDNLHPQAKALAQYVDKTYPNVEISGTTRDADSNAAVGGAKHSQHLDGRAFDMKPLAPMSTDQKVQFFNDMAAHGARGLGFYPTGSLHADVRTGAPAVWGSDYHYGSFTKEQPAALVQAAQNFRQGVINQANPNPGTTGGTTGGYGSPSGAAAASGPAGPADAQGPDDPRNPAGNARNFNASPANPASTSATPSQSNAGSSKGQSNGKKGDTNEDKMQKLAKAIMGFGALGAKGPLHYAPPATGGSPVNRPDVAQPEVYKGAARILPKINFRGLLG